MNRTAFLVALSLAALTASQAQAQVVTDIAPDAAPGFDTGTVVSTSGSDTQIGGGELSGTNLFHSFAEFDLGNGDTATWVRGAADASTITNVINRVRSGSPSNIDGTLLMADMPNADFWFINPAGVVFGEGAAVQVPNAAHFSTAHEIDFGGGQRFSTVTPDGSTFSSAPPQAFGFLGGQGDILVRDGFAPEAVTGEPTSLTLVGANIGIEGNFDLLRTNIELIAVGDGGPFDLAFADRAQPIGDGSIVMPSGASITSSAGNISLTAANVELDDAQLGTVSVSATDAGDIAIRSGTLTVFDSEIVSHASDSGNAGNIDIAISGDGLFARSNISSSVSDTSFGNGGTISVVAGGALDFAEFNGIRSAGNQQTSAGEIRLAADQLSLETTFVETRADVGADILLEGHTIDVFGAIRLAATGGISAPAGDLLILADESFTIDGDPFNRGGNGLEGHNVTIGAGEMRIATASINSSADPAGLKGAISINVAGAFDMFDASIGRVSFTDPTPGARGSVLITADSMSMTTSKIFADSRTLEPAGDVSVMVDSLFVDAGSEIRTSVFDLGLPGPPSQEPGDAGAIYISAQDALIEGSINSQGGLGDAGQITLNVPGLLRLDSGQITTTAGQDGGAGGSIVIEAGELKMNSGSINAGTGSAGDAGLVEVLATVLMMDGGVIASSTEAEGDAGDVLITADAALIGGDARINSGALPGATGQAGLVAIKTSDLLLVYDDAVISAATAGPGDAGAVVINTNQLVMEGGEIASLTQDAGNAGTVLVNAQSASLTGQATINSLADGDNTGDAGGVGINVAGELIVAEGSIVAASTLGTGNAGKVGVEADTLYLDQAVITSATAGSGDAGDVAIFAREMVLFPDGTVSSEALEFSSGNAGDVIVTVSETLGLELSSSISASSRGSGNAGIVEVKAGVLNMRGGAINSFTGGSGDAGLVGVFVDKLNMSGGRIDSASDSVQEDAGNAGSVFITAGNANIGGWAQIDSRGFAGNAGDVTLDVFGRLEIADTAEISAATDGSGNGGLVQVSADELVMTGGTINSFTGDSGDAGLVEVLARLLTMTGGRIDSSSDSDRSDAGNAGGVLVRGNEVALSGDAVIESRGVVGDAGDVQVEVLGPMSITDAAQISAATDGSGNAGSVFVMADLLSMSGGEINSITNGSGLAGLVTIDVGELVMTGGLISSASQTPRPAASLTAAVGPVALAVPDAGDAGDVFVKANTAVLDAGASINSISVNSNAGSVTLEIAEGLQLRDGGQISTAAFGGGDAGAIEILAGTVLLDEFAQITSTAAGEFSAGLIGIAADEIQILNGSEVSTNSEKGPAGDIALLLPSDGLLRLAGQELPGVITTSSGANTGGRIIISDPFLIVSEGGSILALGQQGGANVEIQSAFFIRSSDALNLVSVDGSLLIESNVGEQITGTEVAEVPFLDASGILSGQCAGVRQSGELSQFSSRITGPYAPPDGTVVSDEEEASKEPASERVAHLPMVSMAPCG